MERSQPFVVCLFIVVLLLISLIPAAMARGNDGSSETAELSEPPSAKETKGGDAPVATLTDEVVVTATARREAARKLPFVTTVLDAEVLRDQRQVRTLPEALREVPGVMVQKTSHGQGSPFLRGFTGFRTLFLVDGVRLDTSVMREGPTQYWTTVDAWALERIEVPASWAGAGHEAYQEAGEPEFVSEVMRPMLAQQGDELPVSALPPDGIFPTATTWSQLRCRRLI